jgi:hypothetical protein
MSATGLRAGKDQRSSRVRPEHVELSVGGMTCPHCPPAIENQGH